MKDMMALDMPGRSKLDQVEKAIVTHAYAVAGQNVSAAARLLGIERKAMERRLVLYGVDADYTNAERRRGLSALRRPDVAVYQESRA